MSKNTQKNREPKDAGKNSKKDLRIELPIDLFEKGDFIKRKTGDTWSSILREGIHSMMDRDPSLKFQLKKQIQEENG